MECLGCGKQIEETHSRIFPMCETCASLPGITPHAHNGIISKPFVFHYNNNCNCLTCKKIRELNMQNKIEAKFEKIIMRL